jgi:hypothetical protein
VLAYFGARQGIGQRCNPLKCGKMQALRLASIVSAQKTNLPVLWNGRKLRAKRDHFCGD